MSKYIVNLEMFTKRQLNKAKKKLLSATQEGSNFSIYDLTNSDDKCILGSLCSESVWAGFGYVLRFDCAAKERALAVIASVVESRELESSIKPTRPSSKVGRL